MEKGINSDLVCASEQYHVQTEDWGRDNPFVVTRVYLHGAVVKSVKTSYSDLIPKSGLRDLEMLSQLVQRALRQQHDEILDQLVAGNFFGKRET